MQPHVAVNTVGGLISLNAKEMEDIGRGWYRIWSLVKENLFYSYQRAKLLLQYNNLAHQQQQLR
jgi:hypothetical protein